MFADAVALSMNMTSSSPAKYISILKHTEVTQRDVQEWGKTAGHSIKRKLSCKMNEESFIKIYQHGVKALGHIY